MACGVTADVVGLGWRHDELPVLVHELAVPPHGDLLLGRAEPVPRKVRVSLTERSHEFTYSWVRVHLKFPSELGLQAEP